MVFRQTSGATSAIEAKVARAFRARVGATSSLGARVTRNVAAEAGATSAARAIVTRSFHAGARVTKGIGSRIDQGFPGGVGATNAGERASIADQGGGAKAYFPWTKAVDSGPFEEETPAAVAARLRDAAPSWSTDAGGERATSPDGIAFGNKEPGRGTMSRGTRGPGARSHEKRC